MKRFITLFFVVTLMVFCLAGCSDNKTEQQLLDDTLKIMDDNINDFVGSVNEGTNDSLSVPQSEKQSGALKTPDLDLPLVATDNVYAKVDNSSDYCYITESGALLFYPRDYLGGSVQEIEIDTNVKSVQMQHLGIIYLKTDGSLWGYGKNSYGQLGDGTGVDQANPVKIMEDVATFGVYDYRVYAIKSDLTYWIWGAGTSSGTGFVDVIYEPKMIADNVVRFIVADLVYQTDCYIQTSDGYLLNSQVRRTVDEEAVWDFIPKQPVRDLVTVSVNDGSFIKSHLYWIDADNVLWDRPFDNTFIDMSSFESDVKIAENAVSFYDTFAGTSPGSAHAVFYKGIDGALYGFGDNRIGLLGDGTKIPRDEPVKIADDVIDVGRYAFIKSNGEFWTWGEAQPTPAKTADDAAVFVNENAVIFNDGRIYMDTIYYGEAPYSTFDEQHMIASNIKIPEIVSVP